MNLIALQNSNLKNTLRVIVLLTCLLAVLGSQDALARQKDNRNPNWAQPVNLPESENFYQVTPWLFRSAQPTAAAFVAYEKFGIKTVINLRDKHSDRKHLRGGSSLNLIEIKVKTWDVDDEEVITVLRHLKTAPRPILIHCQHGADRTGTMIAMYRIVFENWSKREALDEMMNGGFGFHRIWKNLPEYINDVDVQKIKKAVGIK